MLRQIARDQSGIALPLAVIMVVLIGVMGAGLLVFANRDLSSIIEANKGQKAFELADAGVALARQQLWFDNIRAHYDVDGAETSPYDLSCDLPPSDPGEAKPRIPTNENWSPEAGVTRSFADGNLTVTIRYLNPLATQTLCKPPKTPTAREDYFQIISTGTYNGAKRKIEAIYRTYDAGAPEAFFAKNSITVGGTADVKDVSLFSTGTVTVSNNAKICGTDRAYDNWVSDYNTTARSTNAAGIGTTGTLTEPSKPGSCPDGSASPVSVNKNVKDFDQNTTTTFLSPPTNPQPANQITFPFKPALDSLDTDALCETAQVQDSLDGAHYQPVSSSGNYSLSSWPANSTVNTIVCVDFITGSGGSRTVNWDVEGTGSLSAPYLSQCEQPIAKGILVVRNGNFSTAQNKALFKGVIAVRGGVVTDGDYSDTGGNTCLEGFANTSDDIQINGNVQPQATTEVINTPGFHRVSLWSWRECYNTSCR